MASSNLAPLALLGIGGGLWWKDQQSKKKAKAKAPGPTPQDSPSDAPSDGTQTDERAPLSPFVSGSNCTQLASTEVIERWLQATATTAFASSLAATLSTVSAFGAVSTLGTISAIGTVSAFGTISVSATVSVSTTALTAPTAASSASSTATHCLLIGELEVNVKQTLLPVSALRIHVLKRINID